MNLVIVNMFSQSFGPLLQCTCISKFHCIGIFFTSPLPPPQFLNWIKKQNGLMCPRTQRGLSECDQQTLQFMHRCTLSLAPSFVRDTSLQPSPARMFSSLMFLRTTSKFILKSYAAVPTTEESRSIKKVLILP